MTIFVFFVRRLGCGIGRGVRRVGRGGGGCNISDGSFVIISEIYKSNNKIIGMATFHLTNINLQTGAKIFTK